MRVWETHIGDRLQGLCTCCKHEAITIANFECGHVVAVALGGRDTIANLRPVCSMCNKSMGTQNMDAYIARIRDCSLDVSQRNADDAMTSEEDDLAESVQAIHISESQMSESKMSESQMDDLSAKVATLALEDKPIGASCSSRCDDGDMVTTDADTEAQTQAEPVRKSPYFDCARSFLYDIAHDDQLVAQMQGCLNKVEQSRGVLTYIINYDDLFRVYVSWCDFRANTGIRAESYAHFRRITKDFFAPESEDPVSAQVIFSLTMLSECLDGARKNARANFDAFASYVSFSSSMAFIEDLLDPDSEQLIQWLIAACRDVLILLDDDIFTNLFIAWKKFNGQQIESDLAAERARFLAVARRLIDSRGSCESQAGSFSRNKLRLALKSKV